MSEDIKVRKGRSIMHIPLERKTWLIEREDDSYNFPSEVVYGFFFDPINQQALQQGLHDKGIDVRVSGTHYTCDGCPNLEDEHCTYSTSEPLKVVRPVGVNGNSRLVEMKPCAVLEEQVNILCNGALSREYAVDSIEWPAQEDISRKRPYAFERFFGKLRDLI